MATLKAEDVAVALGKLELWHAKVRDDHWSYSGVVGSFPEREFKMVMEVAESWVDLMRVLAMVEDPDLRARALEDMERRRT